jgi:hypothetical protein
VPTREALEVAHRTLAALELEQLNWPPQNAAPRPTLDEYLPKGALTKRVEEPLLMSAALEALYGDPVTPEQLQAELAREAEATKKPERLRELWATLGNEPTLIAEVVARPILAENRLRARYYADEKIHGPLREAALAELSRLVDPRELRALSGAYHEVEYRLVLEGEREDGSPEERDQRIERREPAQWESLISSLGEIFGRSDPQGPSSLAGSVSELRDATEHYYVQAVLESGPDRVRIGTMSWAKTPFTLWWEKTREGFLEKGIACTLAQPRQVSLPEVPQKAFHQPEGWEAISDTGAPIGRKLYAWQSAGSVVVAWGGQDNTNTLLRSGGRYNPVTDSWQATSEGTNCPAAQLVETWAWTGSELVIWDGATRVGRRYNPVSDTWTTMSSTNDPGLRSAYSMVWSESEVIVWGGFYGGEFFNTGGKYNPTTDTWTTTGMGGSVPAVRDRHSATWDWMTNWMHVWGGLGSVCLSSGGLNKGSSTWYSMSTSNAPSARWNHSQVSYPGWGILVWGGNCGNDTYNTGGWYNGDTSGTWNTITTTDAPTARAYHAAIWGYNGREMIIWGGQTDISNTTNTGGRYNPITNTWAPLPTAGAPSARSYTHGVDLASDGLMMLIWGGDNAIPTTPYDRTGGIYVLCSENFPFLQSSPATTTDPSACAQGIQITWKDAQSWFDSGYGTRSYEIYRDAVLLATPSYGTTTYTDSATAVGTTYSYVVRYINGCGHSNDSGAVTASDSFGVVPSSLTNNTAADVSGCADSGVTVTWAAPGNWGDNGSGTRSIDVLRGGTAIATGLSVTTTTYTDTTGTNGIAYTYTVRFNNGCGLNASTSGASAADNIGAAPSSLTNNTAADASDCLDSGVTVTWVAPGSWGDSGSGTRTIDVLRGATPIATGLAAAAITYTDTTGTNSTAYTYSVRINNGCSLSATTTGASATDQVGAAPSSLTNNTAADVSACADSGVTVTWAAPGNWGDNGSGTRTIDVLRGATPIATGLAATATTYTDTTGTNFTAYTYSVRFNNGCSLSATTTGASATDQVGAAPSSLTNNTAADVSACADSGVTVTWAAPGNWGDNGSGTRTIDVLRGGSPIASGLAATTTTYTDTTGTNGAPYTYTVAFKNGCGLKSETTGALATDQVGTAPSSLTNNTAADVSTCADSGVTVTWAAPGNWGDNGTGTRGIEVLRGGIGIVSELPSTTTTFTDTTGTNGTTYAYTIRFKNGCGLSSTTTGASAADQVGAAPSSLTNNTAADVSACADSGVTVTWVAPGNWGDNGSGVRTIDVLRSGTPIATSLSSTTTTLTDTTGTNGNAYTYTVRFNNGCSLNATTTGASATDVVDTTACPAVGNSLTLTDTGTNLNVGWTAVSCSDLANYRVYGATTYAATFPAGWTLIGQPTGTGASDSYGSAYVAYKTVSVDGCGNVSTN